MAVLRRIIWTDENNNETEIKFGADGENVNIDGSSLTAILSAFEERIAALEAGIPSKPHTAVTGTAICGSAVCGTEG